VGFIPWRRYLHEEKYLILGEMAYNRGETPRFLILVVAL
jgi:hypothetical protein